MSKKIKTVLTVGGSTRSGFPARGRNSLDRSASVSVDLFAEYVRAVKEQLSTEPADSRVWISTIDGDSFGGDHTLILEGWTPAVHGIPGTGVT